MNKLLIPTLLLATATAHGGTARTIDEHRAVDPQGHVEVSNVAGRVDIVGWDKAEVAVNGTLGSGIERVDINAAGLHTTIRVVGHDGPGGLHLWGASGSNEAHLTVHVPRRSATSAQLVSADFSQTGVDGKTDVQTVSGDVALEAHDELRVHTVSGDVKVSASGNAHLVDVATVSGDLTVEGASGEVSAYTVSGDGNIRGGTLNRVKLKTVSGDFTLAVGLAADGRFDAESVSGDFNITFRAGALPAADYELQSFSGDLTTCTGRHAVREGWGPSQRLTFREGAGTAHVHVDTKSGDVSLCAKN